MRTLAKTVGILAALGTLVVSGAASADKVTFTFATSNTTKMLSVQAMQRFADRIKEASNGELDMKIVAGGALGGDKQLLQQLSTNEIQLHSAGPVVVHHLAKPYQCMEAEFVYKDGDHGLRVWNGALGNEVSKFLQDKYDIRIVGVGHRGARNLTSNKPVKVPADMKGMKVRITNKLRQKVFQAFGANPVPMSIKEVYGALQTGTIEAQENPVGTIFGHAFQEVQDYLNMTGHVWSYFVYSANNSFYTGLSDKHREIFDNEMAKTIDWLNRETVKSWDDYVAKLKAGGMTVVEPDVDAFAKIAKPIVTEFAKESCRPGLLDDIAKLAN